MAHEKLRDGAINNDRIEAKQVKTNEILRLLFARVKENSNDGAYNFNDAGYKINNPSIPPSLAQKSMESQVNKAKPVVPHIPAEEKAPIVPSDMNITELTEMQLQIMDTTVEVFISNLAAIVKTASKILDVYKACKESKNFDDITHRLNAIGGKDENYIKAAQQIHSLYHPQLLENKYQSFSNSGALVPPEGLWQASLPGNIKANMKILIDDAAIEPQSIGARI